MLNGDIKDVSYKRLRLFFFLKCYISNVLFRLITFCCPKDAQLSLCLGTNNDRYLRWKLKNKFKVIFETSDYQKTKSILDFWICSCELCNFLANILSIDRYLLLHPSMLMIRFICILLLYLKLQQRSKPDAANWCNYGNVLLYFVIDKVTEWYQLLEVTMGVVCFPYRCRVPNVISTAHQYNSISIAYRKWIMQHLPWYNIYLHKYEYKCNETFHLPAYFDEIISTSYLQEHDGCAKASQ